MKTKPFKNILMAGIFASTCTAAYGMEEDPLLAQEIARQEHYSNASHDITHMLLSVKNEQGLKDLFQDNSEHSIDQELYNVEECRIEPSDVADPAGGQRDLLVTLKLQSHETTTEKRIIIGTSILFPTQEEVASTFHSLTRSNLKGQFITHLPISPKLPPAEVNDGMRGLRTLLLSPLPENGSQKIALGKAKYTVDGQSNPSGFWAGRRAMNLGRFVSSKDNTQSDIFSRLRIPLRAIVRTAEIERIKPNSDVSPCWMEETMSIGTEHNDPNSNRLTDYSPTVKYGLFATCALAAAATAWGLYAWFTR